MALAQATVALRRPLLAQIGQVIVNWAYLEHVLHETIILIAEVDPKIGRMVLHEPPAKERVQRIKKILEYRKIAISVDLAALYEEIVEIEHDRNNLAHGVWVTIRPRVSSTSWPLLRVTSGNLDTAAHKLQKQYPGKMPRKMLPEAIEYGTEDTRALAATILELGVRANAARLEIKAALAASQGKPAEPPPDASSPQEAPLQELDTPPDTSRE